MSFYFSFLSGKSDQVLVDLQIAAWLCSLRFAASLHNLAVFIGLIFLFYFMAPVLVLGTAKRCWTFKLPQHGLTTTDHRPPRRTFWSFVESTEPPLKGTVGFPSAPTPPDVISPLCACVCKNIMFWRRLCCGKCDSEITGRPAVEPQENISSGEQTRCHLSSSHHSCRFALAS